MAVVSLVAGLVIGEELLCGMFHGKLQQRSFDIREMTKDGNEPPHQTYFTAPTPDWGISSMISVWSPMHCAKDTNKCGNIGNILCCVGGKYRYRLNVVKKKERG